MKKYGYYTLIIIELIAIIAIVILPFAFPIIFTRCWQMLLSIIVGIPLLALVCLGIEFRNIFLQEDLKIEEQGQQHINENRDNPSPKNDDDPNNLASKKPEEKTAPIPPAVSVVETPDLQGKEIEENSLYNKWSQSMYQRYNSQWDDLFDHIHRQITPEEKGKISLLLWELASQTINYLKETNPDVNRLRYHSDGVKMITDNLPLEDLDLKAFYKDPSTVPVKAIAIYEWLEEQGVKVDTTAFGYHLNLSNK